MSSIPSDRLPECSICFEKIEESHTLTCDHIFHNKCAITWFNSSILTTSKPTCPLCRADQSQDRGILQINEFAKSIIDENWIAARHLLADPLTQAHINLLAGYDRQPALYRAVDNDHFELISQLLDLGADVAIRATDEVDEEEDDVTLAYSSLAIACFRELETLDLVLKNSSKEQLNNINDREGSLLSFYLHFALEDDQDLLFGYEDDVMINVMSRLLAAGADINLPDPDTERTPLQSTISHERGTLAHFLLENGANPNKSSSEESTPLILAMMRQRVDIVWMLLDKGASLSVPSQFSLHQFAEEYFSELSAAIPDKHKNIAKHPAISPFLDQPQLLRDLMSFIAALESYYAHDPFAPKLDISKTAVPGSIAPYPALFLAVLANKVHLIWRLISEFHADIHARYRIDDNVVISPFELGEKLKREHLIQDGYLVEETHDDLPTHSPAKDILPNEV